mmetsp:Transcript_23089/g.59319  ORF Transcript_23089/g.59319 Transcript_23089/m.59319 type:complete len:149 (-) Transcript_23089:267-713(-)
MLGGLLVMLPRAGVALSCRASAFAPTKAGIRSPAAVRMLSFGAPPSYDIADVLEEIKAGDAQLIDVRERHEWAAGHLQHAHLAPLSELQQGILAAAVDQDAKLYVHCAAGVRVHAAAPLMRSLGCGEVVPLREGFASLLELGMPIASD